MKLKGDSASVKGHRRGKMKNEKIWLQADNSMVCKMCQGGAMLWLKNRDRA